MIDLTVVSYVSTAIDMLEFSEDLLHAHTGKVPPYRRLIVTWDPSPEVAHWLDLHSNRIRRVEYRADPRLGYVPNLRGMMMLGWQTAFEMGDWLVHTDTDVAYGTGWLQELLGYSSNPTPRTIVNCTHITPNVSGPHVITANFGRPTWKEFDLTAFWKLHDQIRRPGCYETADFRGGWEATATMPYLIHRQWWEKCGPWEMTLDGKKEAPDRRFFRRCAEAGAKFVLACGSVVYHYEGGERRSGQRPGAAQGLPEEGRV